MKKFFVLILAAVALTAQQSAAAATFRVNNTAGSGAKYTTYEAAEDAASDGDVIIVDGSKTSYGKIVIKKKITLKGPGYFLNENGSTNEAADPATFDEIKVQAEGAVLTGLDITGGNGEIYLQRNNIVVTRCFVQRIYTSVPNSYTDKFISNCVIHQNYIRYGILGDSYSAPAIYFQITNNIFPGGSNTTWYNLDHATISRNTVVPSYDSGFANLTNCVIENNICPEIKVEDGTTFSNNYIVIPGENKSPYYGKVNNLDRNVKAIDEKLTTTQGAFSGNDPYVLSGLPTGPVIQDIIMPESVVKGETLNVTVKIAKSK